jgi:hypothetical protein
MPIVYRIRTHDMKLDHYQICRQERWTVEKDETFDSLEEARKYVIEKSKQVTDMISVLNLPFLPEQKRQQAMEDFCFDNDLYLVHRRLFVDHVPLKEMKQALGDRGIKVAHVEGVEKE